ncbi:hypothetical protein Q7P36_008043 [Cladosporium allicinum]
MTATHRVELPVICASEHFDAVVAKLARYMIKSITTSHSFEELRTTQYANTLQPLVTYLSDNVHHPATVHALLALKGHFSALENEDDRGITLTRGLAYLVQRKGSQDGESQPDPGERSPLLSQAEARSEDIENDQPIDTDVTDTSIAKNYQQLNALEIAAVCDAKKFLSQRAVQRIIDGIWKGDIMFWQTMSPNAVKQATLYHSKRCDPFTRLRVPLYLKIFEVLFFAAFLAFYYTVLVQKSFHAVTAEEVMLYIWLTAFTYNELVEFRDAGFTFYAADFWAIWDLGIIAVGIAFFVSRMIGLSTDHRITTDTAFDILALEALLLVPRICSLLSLHPYFGTLLPCLKAMTKDFIKFLALVFVLYLGFNTTFGFLARGTFSFREMSWILIKVFFGSSYLGFDVAEQISPTMGPPLMLVFCVATNFLLLTILICLLSKSYDKVMEHARDEYLFVYAVYVLEASTSNRLTYFLPPLNLLPLVLRPLRLFVAPNSLRACRIALLKATHWPLVALILAYENGRRAVDRRGQADSSMTTASAGTVSRSSLMRRPLSSRSVQTRLKIKISDPPTGAQVLTGQRSHDRPQSRAASSRNRIDTLEALAESLQLQLHTVNSLIEDEKTQSSSLDA